MFGIRGVSHLFKRIDKNGNKQIDVNEFYWGLKEFGVNLTEEEAMGVLRIFDKDKSGTISFEEFLRSLKGDLNNFRVGIIRKAYEKLDVNKDGSVRLDDVEGGKSCRPAKKGDDHWHSLFFSLANESDF